MLYFGIIIFLIGAWQSIAKGLYSSVIGSIGLILGTILVFFSNWRAGLFIIFFFVSWLILMSFYSLMTYHKKFFQILPLFVGYAAIVGFMLHSFLSNFFWWYVALCTLMLVVNLKKQWRAREMVLAYSKVGPGKVPDIILAAKYKMDLAQFLKMSEAVSTEEGRVIAIKSVTNTIKYHILSSIIFLAGISIIFNQLPS